MLKGIVWLALGALLYTPLAHAQGSATDLISLLPKCAVSPVTDAAAASGCQMDDLACMCTNDAFLAQVETGVLASCSMKQALSLKNTTMTACNAPIRDRSHEYATLSIVLGSISGLLVIQRFAIKFMARLPFGADDYLTLAIILSGIPNTVNNVHGVGANGLGLDIWTLPYSKIYNFGRFFYALTIVYFFLVALIKLAMLAFYLRIFPAREVRRLLWGTVLAVCLFGVTFILLAIFQCRPINHFWMKWDGEHEGTCLDIDWIAWANAAVSISLDIWMLAVPMWQLRTLNLDWKKKLGVGLMFTLGTFVTIVSGLRLRSLILFDSNDINPTWNYVEVSIWSTIEINVGIICVCLPTLRLLLVKLFPRLFGTVRSGGRYYDNNGYGPDVNGRLPGGAVGSVDHAPKRLRSVWPDMTIMNDDDDDDRSSGEGPATMRGGRSDKGPVLGLRELSSSMVGGNSISVSGGSEEGIQMSDQPGVPDRRIICRKMFTIERTGGTDEESLVTSQQKR